MGIVGAHHGVLDVLDVLYTQDPMEITESQVAKLLTENQVSKVYCEANNGGEGFSRNISRIMREMGNQKTYVQSFTQTQNKMARILSNATNVTNCIQWPVGWKDRWPQIYQELRSASRTRKMLHDDLEDMLVGLCEKCLVNVYEVW